MEVMFILIENVAELFLFEMKCDILHRFLHV